MQVAWLHNEFEVKLGHFVIGEVFFGIPCKEFLIESLLADAEGVCVEHQMVQTDPCGYAQVVIGNENDWDQILVPDLVLGLATPCPIQAASHPMKKFVQSKMNRMPNRPNHLM